jgi:hypothetical protein
MKLPPVLLFIAILLIGFVAPIFAAPPAFNVKQDVILSVSPSHITLRRNQLVPTTGGINKLVPVDTTYIINQFTRAEINGKREDISALEVGMIASVTGDIDTAKNERTARLIVARDKPVPSVVKQPRPAKASQKAK